MTFYLPLLILAAVPLAAPAAATPAQAAPQQTVPAAPVPTRYFTAQSLKLRCEDAQPQSVSSCFAFVAAVYDTSRAYQQWMSFREFCVPADIAQGELRSAMLAYLDLHPRENDAQAASVVVLALKDRYPCPVEALVPGATSVPPEVPKAAVSAR